MESHIGDLTKEEEKDVAIVLSFCNFIKTQIKDINENRIDINITQSNEESKEEIENVERELINTLDKQLFVDKDGIYIKSVV